MASRAATGGEAEAAAPRGDVAELPVRNHGLLVIGIMTATLLHVLDGTIANVALPHMQTALGATRDTVTWVLTSYIIASAVAMPVTGWLADRLGARRLFLWAVTGFVFFSMLCGLATSLEEMVLYRAMQGVTGAFVAPLSQSFILDTTRPSRQPKMIALWGLGIMIGPILGPVLGGWLTENWNWRWVFFVNLPVGLFSLALLWAFLPERDAPRRPFDALGFAILAVGLASFQLLLDRGTHIDWFESSEAWIYGGLIVSALWMAIIHFSSAREPLFDRRLFTDRNFVASLACLLVTGAIMFATMALLPLMLQNLLGYDVIDAGWMMVPRGIGIVISMQIAGTLMSRGFDPRPLVAVGFALSAISLWQMAGWSLALDRWHIVSSGVIQGLGMGLVFIPVNTVAFATLPPRLRTDGSSLLNLFRAIGSSFGISIVTVVLARKIQINHAELAERVTASDAQLLGPAAWETLRSVGGAALYALDGEITRQAAMKAYVDDYWLLMWLCIAAIPLAALMNPRGRRT